MKRVVIESPYRGHIPVNEIYGEFCMHDCLVNHNEAPYASHLLYTRTWVLRDDVPNDRKLGIEAAFLWRDAAEQTNVYMDLGMSEGMQLGVLDCVKKKKPYELRSLPDELWERFTLICNVKGLGIPKKILTKEQYNKV